MRGALPPQPRALVDGGGAPIAGAFTVADDPGEIALAGDGRALARLREKRWIYACAMAEDCLFACAVVDLGYASNAFVLVADPRRGALTTRRSLLGLPGTKVSVGRRPGRGAEASFAQGRSIVRLTQPGTDGALGIEVRAGEFHAELSLEEGPAPAFAAAGALDGRGAYTQKTALRPVRGRIREGAAWRSLDGALGGTDYTAGYLMRETTWFWAFALGRLDDGVAVGLNLARGNNLGGQVENALWIGGRLSALPPVEFERDADAPTAPWRITSADGAVDLRFRGEGMYFDARNLVVVRSRFIQIAGRFEGTVRDGDGVTRTLAVPGVVEDQQVLW